MKKASKKFYYKNSHLNNEKSARRRASIRNANVSWANKKKINEFYLEAKRLTIETGVKHHVDHIYPLTSDVICGLHNEFNLQVLTSFENPSKHNRFTP